MRLPCHALFVLALVQSLALCQGANSQTIPEKKTAGATISGKVTIKGKAAGGIVVGVRLNEDSRSPRTSQATTGEDGIYHITGVPSGSVILETKQRVTVTNGETTEVEITLDLSLAAKP